MSNEVIYIQAKGSLDKKDSDSYRTPLWLFDYLNNIHNFDVDICSSDINKLCDNFFTIDNNALEKQWIKHGKMGYCNPPYSRGEKEKFLDKAFLEMKNGFSTVFVIPADLSNICWKEKIIGKATKITVISGRVSFDKPEHARVKSGAGVGVSIVEFISNKESNNNIYFVSRDELIKNYEKDFKG